MDAISRHRGIYLTTLLIIIFKGVQLEITRRMLNEDPEFDASESSDSSSDSQLDVSEKSNSDSDW